MTVCFHEFVAWAFETGFVEISKRGAYHLRMNQL